MYDRLLKFKIMINDKIYPISRDNFYCENIVNGVSAFDVVVTDVNNDLSIEDLETDTFVRLICYETDFLHNVLDSYVYMDGLIDSYTLTKDSNVNFYNLRILGLLEVLKDTLIDKYYEDYVGSFKEILEGIINKEIENDEIFLSGVIFNITDFDISEISINETLYDFLMRLCEEYKFIFYIKEVSDGDYKLVISDINDTVSNTLVDSDIIYEYNKLTLNNDGGNSLYSDVRYLNAYYPSDTKYKDVLNGNGSTKRFEFKYNPYLVNVATDIIIKVQMTPSSEILTVPSNLIGFTDEDYENEDDFAYFIQRKEDELFDTSLIQSGSTKEGVEEYCLTLDDNGKIIVEYIYGVQIKQDYQNIETRNKIVSRSKGVRRKKVRLVDDFVFGKSKIESKGLRLTTDNSNKIVNLEIDSFKFLELGSVVHLQSDLNGLDGIFYVQSCNLNTDEGLVNYRYSLSNIVFLVDKERERLNKNNNKALSNRISNSGFSGGTSRIISNKMIFNIVDSTPEYSTLVQAEGFLNRNRGEI